ncbi:hypothetical protein B9Z55_001074 [Caenorhabditis nigoni]|uniref:Uncharacterized protein n=1 Tax=Caenorhabditis nigoni TaxID=1611254 RepID=A0A2G5VE68_9PELO|nr:hypothetical protein B9Z55_001074 [Caenorhabditis nigoni]
MGSRRRLDHSDAFDQHSDSTTPKILLLSPEQLMFDYTNGIFLNGMFDKGMGSGRCLSSASPISAAERQQLWGSSMHHSFDDRPSASSEDLFASCNDIDNAVSGFFSFDLLNSL